MGRWVGRGQSVVRQTNPEVSWPRLLMGLVVGVEAVTDLLGEVVAQDSLEVDGDDRRDSIEENLAR